MPVTRFDKTTEFLCDACGTVRVEKNAVRWQDRKLPHAKARNAGWRFTMDDAAYCPECSSSSGYSLDDILA
jgi:hypothetical protein